MSTSELLRKKAMAFLALLEHKEHINKQDIFKFLSDFAFNYGTLSLVQLFLKSNADTESLESHISYMTNREYIVSDYIRPQKAVLDIGCGLGFLGVVLAKEKKCKYIGIDKNAERINVGIHFREIFNLGENFSLKQIDIINDELPFPNNSFNYVTFVWSFHDIVTEKRESIIKKIAPLVEKDGEVILYEPEDSIDLNEVTQIFEKNGFNKKKIEHFGPIFFHKPQNNAILLIFKKKK